MELTVFMGLEAEPGATIVDVEYRGASVSNVATTLSLKVVDVMPELINVTVGSGATIVL